MPLAVRLSPIRDRTRRSAELALKFGEPAHADECRDQQCESPAIAEHAHRLREQAGRRVARSASDLRRVEGAGIDRGHDPVEPHCATTSLSPPASWPSKAYRSPQKEPSRPTSRKYAAASAGSRRSYPRSSLPRYQPRARRHSVARSMT